MTNPTFTRFLTEADVVQLIDLNDAMAALTEMLSVESTGTARSLPKMLATYGDRCSMHSLGSYAESLNVAGFKNWINTPNGATSVMSVFDPENGHLRAVVQAACMGRLRTASASGIATDWMATADASELAIVGTGRQAMLQVAAVSAVRKLTRVRVYSPTRENREKFAAQLREHFEFEVEAASSLESAVADAPIVTLITRAREPFLSGRLLAGDAHLNAVGSVLPSSAEFAQDVFDRAVRIAVDNVERCIANSKEFRDKFGTDESDWARVETIGEIISAGRTTRAPGVSLFKAVGTGLADLAVARVVLERAEQQDLGIKIDKVAPPLPRWQAL